MTEKEKIKLYLKYKGITKHKFYTDTNLSIGFLDSGRSLVLDKVKIIIDKYPDLNLIWLILVYGDMIVNNRPIQGIILDTWQKVLSGDELQQKKKNNYYIPVSKREDKEETEKAEVNHIPLYDFDSSKGLSSVFDGSTVPAGYISIPELPRCDGAVRVRGDSMSPLLKAGDVVIYKQLHNCKSIIWGEMYLVSFDYDDQQEYTTVRYLNRIDDKPDYVQLVSYGNHSAPIDVPISAIRTLAIVKASVRLNTME